MKPGEADYSEQRAGVNRTPPPASAGDPIGMPAGAGELGVMHENSVPSRGATSDTDGHAGGDCSTGSPALAGGSMPLWNVLANWCAASMRRPDGAVMQA